MDARETTSIGGMPLPFANFFGNLKDFVYFPTTVFQPLWDQSVSPKFYFGCNVDDAPTERKVLGKVGSYGSQLNIVLDALAVLLTRVSPETLTEDERGHVRALVDLMDRADRAAAEAAHKSPQMLALQLAPWVQVRPPSAPPRARKATARAPSAAKGKAGA
jgi:hypothetical protein